MNPRNPQRLLPILALLATAACVTQPSVSYEEPSEEMSLFPYTTELGVGFYDFRARLFGYHLGSGLDPDRPDISKLPCIESFRTETLPPASHPHQWRLKVKFPATALTEDARLAYSLGSGGYEPNFLALRSNHPKRITAYIIGNQFGDRELIKGYQLSHEAKELLAKNPASFREECGSMYMAQVQKGASFILRLSINNLTSGEALDWYGNGAGGLNGASSADFQSKFENALATHLELGDVEFAFEEFAGLGNTGVAALSNLVKIKRRLRSAGATKVDQVLNVLAHVLEELEIKGDTPIYSTAAPFFEVEDSDIPFMSPAKFRSLGEIALKYNQASDLLAAASSLIDDPSLKVDLGRFATTQATEELGILEAYLETLAKAHTQCLQSKPQMLHSACKRPSAPSRWSYLFMFVQNRLRRSQ